jgi:Na+/H+ antiporter NhaD/arsenite permease-like protein
MIDGPAIATLVVFIVSIFFVIVPIRIPLPRSKRLPSHIPINLTTAPILAIAILWAAQCLGPSVIRGGIVGGEGIKPYNILILFFSLAYMSITLDITGVLQAAAFWVSNKGGSNGWKLFFYFYVFLTTLSVATGNDPVILSGTVFLVYYTNAVKLDPIAWLITEFAAANTASMVLFVGNPTNVVICEGFGVNNVAYSAYTVFPFVACSVFCFVALVVQFHAHVPKRLDKAEKLDPWSVLHDPIGAVVGSILLGSCLVVIIVVSFFGVDVWMISLPFATAKFTFDMGWDHWRDRKGRLTRPYEPGSQEKNLQTPTSSILDFEKQIIASSHRATTGTESASAAESHLHRQEPLSESMTSTAPATNTISPATSSTSFFDRKRSNLVSLRAQFDVHFPTFSIALPRLPFALVPFAFSQFILIEALAHQGWIDIFAVWLVRATGRQIYPTIWVIGVLGVFLCNLSGTNIGATILLTKVVRAAAFPDHSLRAAAIALAVASNVGAVSFTFSASLAGLLWRGILDQKGIHIKQTTFAFWNLLPIICMTVVGLGVVCIEMAVIYR